MNDIPLFVSVPPGMRRSAPDGSEIGDEYQRLCIRSWFDSGLTPKTVNSVRESVNPVAAEMGVVHIGIEKDATDEVGKPLVYLQDLIDTAALADGPVLITNADIILNLDAGELERIRSLQPGEAFFARRLDVSDTDAGQGDIFEHGIDLIGVHSRTLQGLDCGRYVLGMPWWDHYVPIALLAQGVRQVNFLRPEAVVHLLHDERWNIKSWRKFGAAFIEDICGLMDRTDPGTLTVYRAEAGRIVRMEFLTGFQRFRAGLFGWTKPGRKKTLGRKLGRLARLNMSELDMPRNWDRG